VEGKGMKTSEYVKDRFEGGNKRNGFKIWGSNSNSKK